MKISKSYRAAALALGVALGGICIATASQAIPILSFGQMDNLNTVVGTNSGGGSTTIVGTDIAITISQIDAGLSTPFNAVMDFSFLSSSAATFIGTNITQTYSGTFCITTSGSCGGTNYLSGTLNDVAFGKGTTFTLNASTPPTGDVTFSSDVIPLSDLGLDRGVSLSFANVSPALTIVSGSIGSFTSSISGTFSANVGAVPEPASLLLLGAGMAGLGVAKRRKAA